MRAATLFISALAGLALPLCSARAAPLPALFTAQQAATGRSDYLSACSACHGAALQGVTGPSLVGQDFAAPADHYSLSLVFTNLWEGTPAGAPDSLSKSEYVDIMAYLMARNGYPAGGSPLTFAIAQSSSLPFVSQVK
jgi:mono/diheme cytochrome c family protein